MTPAGQRALILGRWLFRRRGHIGVVAFVLVCLLGRPTPASCVQSLPALLLGLAVRLWAAGYIGKAGRVSIPGGETRIVSGPYRLLRHPLYMGNALLVAGMLWAYRPWLVVGVVVMLLFFVEYGFIIAAEEKALAGVPADRDARFGFRRAMTESRTWVAVSAAYALAWFKLALVYGFAVN